jgi:hypothetical protein
MATFWSVASGQSGWSRRKAPLKNLGKSRRPSSPRAASTAGARSPIGVSDTPVLT